MHKNTKRAVCKRHKSINENKCITQQQHESITYKVSIKLLCPFVQTVKVTYVPMNVLERPFRYRKCAPPQTARIGPYYFKICNPSITQDTY